MPLRLYADECVDARILQGLRRRGIDAVCAADEGMLGAPDVAHLEKAASLGRVVPVSSTRAAEKTKILENTYRAVNIAMVNFAGIKEPARLAEPTAGVILVDDDSVAQAPPLQ